MSVSNASFEFSICSEDWGNGFRKIQIYLAYVAVYV
jgi:hypothetical protein